MIVRSAEQNEASRIRQAYARRDYLVPKGRYSLFNEANRLRYLELLREVLALLRRFDYTELGEKSILDVGCGNGAWLRRFIEWGARPADLFGVDLLEESIRSAKELSPPGMTLLCDDASQLKFNEETFDIVAQFAVFTSILNSEVRSRLASEMSRVLKPGGAILWYDFFVSNPRNPDVRRVTREEISRLFPGLRIFLKRITLAPPIGRAIGSAAPPLYHLLSSLKPLCTHYLGFFSKP